MNADNTTRRRALGAALGALAAATACMLAQTGAPDGSAPALTLVSVGRVPAPQATQTITSVVTETSTATETTSVPTTVITTTTTAVPTTVTTVITTTVPGPTIYVEAPPLVR